jgi:hypothetical protein
VHVPSLAHAPAVSWVCLPLISTVFSSWQQTLRLQMRPTEVLALRFATPAAELLLDALSSGPLRLLPGSSESILLLLRCHITDETSTELTMMLRVTGIISMKFKPNHLPFRNDFAVIDHPHDSYNQHRHFQEGEELTAILVLCLIHEGQAQCNEGSTRVLSCAGANQCARYAALWTAERLTVPANYSSKTGAQKRVEVGDRSHANWWRVSQWTSPSHSCQLSALVLAPLAVIRGAIHM